MTDTVVIVQNTAPEVIEVTQSSEPSIVEVIRDNAPTLLEVVAQGPQGPQGPPGTVDLGGYAVNVGDLQMNDVLQFKGTDWKNVRQFVLTDGGNF